MRRDMAQVLIEDARTCSSERSRKWGLRLPYDPDSDYEDQPQRTGRRRRQGYDNKQSTDVLGPLTGYLRSCVGRPWDDVYSEICANLDKRSTTGAHVFTHLWQFVDVNCWIGAKTGKVYTDSDRGPQSVSWFYVHPWTGLLCEIPGGRHWRFPRRKQPVTLIPIDNVERKAYEWIQGIWYYTEYTFVTLFKAEERRYRFLYSPRSTKYEDKVYLVKRQLSKKELRDLGLSNKKLKVA